jgi:hypothetical protein
MKIITAIIRGLINILLFAFYSLFFVIATNFIYWFVVKEIMEKSVPGTENPIHLKMAVLVIFWTFVITLLFRKFFYVPLYTKEKKEKVNEKKWK